ncbi:hypothetical protein DFH08DRAFT_893321 [Mycena albidolilacea]|uniref:Secreted protein n=1 Tax=Mycena albidolilacea TaxID=1033008 RepID=A0AAD7EE46_9AGAR|nr:hypothetical protein DFH08DRAFT_893321 [Mycena albidolilacea]
MLATAWFVLCLAPQGPLPTHHSACGTLDVAQSAFGPSLLSAGRLFSITSSFTSAMRLSCPPLFQDPLPYVIVYRRATSRDADTASSSRSSSLCVFRVHSTADSTSAQSMYRYSGHANMRCTPGCHS